MDNAPDWTLLRSALTVASTGSLSAAARALGLSQPTLGRHVEALEQALGVVLFTRAVGGLSLTPAGQALVEPLRDMEAAARRLALIAAGRQETLKGSVRITASRVVSHHLLPPILVALRAAEPEIEIELVPSEGTENLLFREADIALRMYRPTQADLIAAHVTDLPMGLFAAKSYLGDRPRPATAGDLMALDFVGFDRSDYMLQLMARQGFAARREDFKLRCDDQVVYWSLVRAGGGVGGMQRIIGDGDGAVERIADFLPMPVLPVWLTAVPTLREAPRIRRVYDHLAASLRALRVA